MIIQISEIATIDILAIILSLVSLIITIVGFFASLKFYRDGVDLQTKSNDALTKIEEKTEFIQTQVGGMFDKTLDAAIGNKEILSANFDELNKQLEEAKIKVISEAIKQVGDAGEQESKRLTSLIYDQLNLVREKDDSTEKAAKGFGYKPSYGMTIGQYLILYQLNKSRNGSTLSDISKRVSVEQPSLNLMLSDLVSWHYIEQVGDKYYILPDGMRELNN